MDLEEAEIADSPPQDGTSDSSPEDAQEQQSPEASEPEESIVDAVAAAMETSEDETGEDEPSEPEASEETPAEEEAPTEEEQDAELLANLKGKANKRFRELSGRVKELSDANGILEQEANHYRALNQFIEESNLSGDDVQVALTLAADVRSNPEQALRTLAPIVNSLLTITGRSLPPDLKREVDEGWITPKRAKEIAIQRVEINKREQAIEAEKRRTAEALQASQDRAHEAILRALDSKASEWAKSDPDFKAKEPLIGAEFTRLVSEAGQRGEFPVTIEDNLKIAEEARKRVNKFADSFRIRPPAVKPPLETGGVPPKQYDEPDIVTALQNGLRS